MWKLKEVPSYVKTSRFLCEFLQRCFYLAKLTNTKFILSHTVLPVITSLWTGSLGTHSVHMAVAVEGVFHSGGSITYIFRYLQKMFYCAAFYYQHYFVQFFW